MKNLGFLGICILMSSCGFLDEDKGKNYGAPLIKPPVDESTPAGLKSSSASLARTSRLNLNSAAISTISNALTQTKNSIVGGTCEGLIGCSLTALDYRIDEVNKRTEESERKCQESEPVPFSYSFLGEAGIIQAQCHDVFEPNGTHGDNSGLIFGKKDGEFSIGMTLQQQSSGMYQYIAKFNESTGNVYFFETSWYQEGDNSHNVFYKLLGNRTTKSFELSYASSQDSTGFGCGLQLLSNNQHIYVKGYFSNMDCSSTSLTEFCVDASSLEEVTSGCTLNGTSFSMSMPSHDTVANGIEELKSKMGAKQYADYGISINEDK